MPKNPRALAVSFHPLSHHGGLILVDLQLVGLVCFAFSDGVDRAARAFRQAMATSPNCIDAIFGLVEVHIKHGHYEAAIQL